MDQNDNNTTIPPDPAESLHTRLATHERAIAALNAEHAQLTKQLEALKAERQVLQAVAKKIAKDRRVNGGGQQA